MEPQTQAEIRNTFKEEYVSNAAKEVKGFGGWMLRQADRWAKRVAELETDQKNNWKMVPYMLLPTVIGAYALVFGVIAAPLVTVAAVGAAIWSGNKAWKKANAIADAAIDRDIENGTLPARYNTEILQPKIDKAAQDLEALQKTKSSLPAPGAAAADFAQAVAPKDPVIDTAPKPAVSAPSNTGPA